MTFENFKRKEELVEEFNTASERRRQQIMAELMLIDVMNRYTGGKSSNFHKGKKGSGNKSTNPKHVGKMNYENFFEK